MTAITERSPWQRRRVRLMLVAALLLGLSGAGGAADAAAAGVVTGVVVTGDAVDDLAGDAAPGHPWQWPIEGRQVIIVPFRAPAHDYGPGHRGMDVAAQAGAEVRAPASGVIAFRGTVVDRPLITIDHGGGYVTTLEPVSSDLSAGDAVAAGDVVGALAGGGHAPHGTLHIGVRVEGVYVNPRGLFGRPPRAVLLPCCEG